MAIFERNPNDFLTSTARPWWEKSIIMRPVTLLVDGVVMLLAFAAAYALRFNFSVPEHHQETAPWVFLTVLLLQYGSMVLWGCRRVAWRFITAGDVPRFIAAIGTSTLVSVIIRFLWPEAARLRPPFSVAMINGVLAVGGLLLARVLWRLTLEAQEGNRGVDSMKPVLLLGAGSVGNTVAREMRRHRATGREVIGFLDDNPAKQGTSIQGLPVRGTLAELESVVRKWKVREVIVTISGASGELMRRLVRTCEELGVKVLVAPDYYEILDGSVTVSRLREIDIADLLGRAEVTLGDESALARFLGGRRVLVTGAGGSIGSELARQVLRAGPEQLILVERSENALFQIDRELRRTQRNGTQHVARVADIADLKRMQRIVAETRPQIVLHAAAHKHVPLMETNVCEAIDNNVLATRRLGELAIQANVETFLLLSTDKAVYPTSVMGATKRVAELALQSLNRSEGTRFAAVRFGNVLGASGSVVPIFREQIRRGGPVTVTHPDMRRYFMTIPEAVRLVLQAAARAEGGEIFILDMGEPIRIVELAEEMIRLSGLEPYHDIPIVFTGIRPGEKLFEELSTDAENAQRTCHPRIFTGRIATRTDQEMTALLQDLEAVAATGDEAAAGSLLMAAVERPNNIFGKKSGVRSPNSE